MGFSALVVGYVVDCEVEFCCGAGEHGADWWRGKGNGIGRIWENSRYVEYLGRKNKVGRIRKVGRWANGDVGNASASRFVRVGEGREIPVAYRRIGCSWHSIIPPLRLHASLELPSSVSVTSLEVPFTYTYFSTTLCILGKNAAATCLLRPGRKHVRAMKFQRPIAAQPKPY